MAAPAAGYGDASAFIRVLLNRSPPPCRDAAALAATTRETAEEDMETDGEHLEPDSSEEDEDEQDDGEQVESDGEDADAEEFMEVEADDEGGEEISDSDGVAAAEADVQEIQGDSEHYESSGDEESMEDEEDQEEVEDECEVGAAGSAGVSEEDSPRSIASVAASPYARAGGTVVEDVMVADADALECGVCFLPLKPPIFQCVRGHVVCLPCHDKLKATAKCHVCGIATNGYTRCYAMEHLVVSIRTRCPHAAHGCDARPAYHSRDTHGRACPHTPCLCPDSSCSFIGSLTALLDHFATVHGWPCTSKVRASETFSIRLHDGFNFVGADRIAGDDRGAISSSPPLLFLLKVTRERLGRAISVLHIQPNAKAAYGTDNCGDHRPVPLTCECELIFSHYDDHGSNGVPCRRYDQSSEFQVACSDLSNGLPNPDLCFQFVVPNSVLGDDEEGIQVKARIVIN